MKIPITKPYFGEEEFEIIQEPLKSGWVVQGPFVAQFEGKFSTYTQATHSIAASSCTTALHLAVAALGLKPGDEVIVPAFTWVSTANVVEYMGATPIFCDIDLRTFNIDPGLIEALITPQTVGIIPVHLFGLSAEMHPIMKIAQAHNLWVVEDAACGLGAWYHDQHVGTFGEAGCFSFHPRKSITTGEGGMVTTQSADLAEQMRSLRDHGSSRSDFARHDGKAGFLLAEYNQLGYNYRMTDMQGALGCAQMERLTWLLDQRRRLALRYDEYLSNLDWLETPLVPEGYIHGYQSYVCLFRPLEPQFNNLDKLFEQRNQVMAQLEDAGIATRQGTHAPVTQGFYAQKYGLRPEDFPQSILAEKISLSLPLYAQMSEAEQDFVIETLQAAYLKN